MSTPSQAVSQMLSAGRPRIGRTPLPISALSAYNPNRPDADESIWQPFYDFQAYPAAGSNQLLFFQTPQGQQGKTYYDTNMLIAGSFPAPTALLVLGVMVVFMPNYSTNNGYIGPVSATAAAAVASQNWNDVNRISQSGYLQLTIGSKPYLYDAPIGKFPPNFTLAGATSMAGQGTDDAFTYVDYARAVGKYYEITPFLIPQTQNFSVSLNWPTLVPTVSTNPGRIGVILDGFYYRKSQ